MSIIEAEGTTEEEALQKAMASLGVTDRAQVVIQEQKTIRKFLGVGGRVVKVKVALKGTDEEPSDDFEDMTKPHEEPLSYEEEVLDVQSEEEGPEERTLREPEPIPEDVVTFESLYRPWIAKGPSAIVVPKRGRGFGRRVYESDPLHEEEEIEEQIAPEPEVVHQTYEDHPESPVGEETRDIGVSFVQQVIDDMGIEGEVTGYRLADRLLIKVDSEASGLLIGRRGETLDALQYLADIVINRQVEHRVRVVIDTEDYRDRRKVRLVEIAHEAAEEAVRRNREIPLAPMNPADRRVIHTTLADDRKVETYSDGAGSRRRVIVKPLRSQSKGRPGGKGKGGGYGKSRGGGRSRNDRDRGYR